MSERRHNLDYESRTSWTPDWLDRNWPVLFGIASNAGIFAIVGPMMALIGVGGLLVPSVVIPWYWGRIDTTIGRWLVVLAWFAAGFASITFLTWRYRRWRARTASDTTVPT